MKTRIITLLLAILAIVIGGAYAQTKIKVHKGGEAIYSVPLTDIDSVGFTKVTSSVHNGHEFVDLGLPSGTKWATCNVGATTPEGFGNYYAWAETSPKDYYSWDNYIYCDGIGSRITKYATGYSYSQDPDGLTVLEMSDDVARVDWGGSWRIPTEEEMTELIINSNWTWATQNGVSGYKVTSTVNGNSIFLPATGAKGDGYVSNQEYAYYWTNSIRSIVNNSANALYYINAYAPTSTGNLSRCSGASVRAVCNIDGGNTQTKVSIYKEDDVIYSRPIAEIDSIKFEREYNGISTEKYYRIKNVESGLYLNAVNYDFHYTGSFGGVNCSAYAQDADQIFKFEVSGDKFKVITNSGYYLYCQQWIVDAQTAGVDLSFVKNDDETYDIMFGESYFAVDEVNGYYYPFCNATEGEKATWVLEEATPLPTYTVSVSATEGGTASASVNSMAQGGSATLFATPESGYRFVNWTVNGSEVSTENIFVATITANTEFVANFEERTTESGISLTKEYRIKDVASGCYLNIADNYIHSGGTNGGVNCVAYAENDNQIFVFEASGTNYYLKSKSGYYIYCQQWNVDGLTYGSELTFIDNPDGTYYIKNGANYFKVEDVNGAYYPFCDAPADLRATWVLEQVGGEEPEPIPTYTVSVSSTQGGTVTTSAESVEEGGSVILTATPETGYRFVNWTLNSNVVSVSNPFIATITANSEFVANFEAEENQSGELHNGHEYVDLGLPSGLKWATCNVGATTPEEYGNNYAWGETTPQSWLATEYTYNDNPEVLPLSADAANVNWGGNWRMPTKAEQEELMDTDNCTWEWTTQNEVNGYKVTSKKNGNSIFLPGAANSGYYWSSSAYPGSTFYAYCLMFTSVSVNCDYSQRNYGQSVRAVFGEKQTFTVSVSAGTGGSATASALEVEQGGSVTLTATPETGYVFKNWTLGGEVVSTENPYTTTINANSEFVANFEEEESSGEDNEPIICTVSVGAASTDGSATASATSVEQGGTVILTATPNEGYEFKYWKDLMGDDVLSTDNPYVATVTQNTTFEACFKPKKFTVTVSSTEGGTAQTSSTIVDYDWKVTLTATPDPGYKFIGWQENGVMVGDDSDQVWTLYIYENRKFTAKFEKLLDHVGAHNGYEYVDLGLPSGTKWAICNVGAEKWDDLGGYAAWGETSSKDSYTAENYTYSANPATLPLSADVANVYMGGNWRMPTEEEVQELIDYCTWSQTVSVSNIGTRGHHVTSNINGVSIFIPATGYTQGSVLEPKQYITQIWTSSIDSEDNQYAKSMYVYGTGTRKVQSSLRYKGLPIRAVLDLETVSLTVSATEGGVVNSRYSTVVKGESITLVATPKSGYNFKNWTLNGTVVSTSSTYTGTVTTNSNFVANFEQTTENGHVYVDLGLSVKWATCNVGATKAEEEGDYFAWGETETKEIYNWETYKWCNGTYNSMTKYCSDSQYGTVDNKTILDIEDDAARANWGGTWRMPTEAEIEEMEENCIITKTTLNGVNGWTITSEINGNSIFVPVNGHYEDGNLKHEEYNFASTWSSSYYDYGNYRATTFRIASHYLSASFEYRHKGYPVRAVCE